MKKNNFLSLALLILLVLLNSCISREPYYWVWDSKKDTAFKAIHRNNIATLHKMIKKRVSVDSQDERGSTLLARAVFFNRIEMIKLLVANKVNVNLFKRNDNFGLNPAMNHVQSLSACKLLIDAGANVNINGYGGRTPLMSILESQNVSYDMVKMLLDAGANPNQVDDSGNNALHYYASRNVKVKTAILKLLLKYGANPNILNKEGKTPLHLLASSNSNIIENVKLLLEAGANPNLYKKGKRYWGKQIPPLIDAIKYGHYKVVELLIKYGADLNSKYVIYICGMFPGEKYPTITPLSAAIEAKRLPVINLLIKHNAKVSKQQRLIIKAIQPPESLKSLNLFNLVYSGNNATRYDLFKRAISAGADINKKNEYGQTVLEKVIADIDLTTLILQSGASAYAKNGALRRACEIDNIDIIKLLLKHDANPNEKDMRNSHLRKSRPTAIFFVKSITALNILLKAGANINYLNDYGENMLQSGRDPLFIKAAFKAGLKFRNINMVRWIRCKKMEAEVKALIDCGVSRAMIDELSYKYDNENLKYLLKYIWK